MGAFVSALAIDHSLVEAREAIVTLSTTSPPSSGGPFELAVALKAAGYLTAAATEVQRVFKEEAPTKEQIELLQTLGLGGPDSAPLAGAQNLYDAGFHDAAEEETRKVLAETESSLAVPQELKGEDSQWLADLPGWVARWTTRIAALTLVAVPFLALFLLLHLVPLRGGRAVKVLRRLREGPGLRRVFTPQLLIGEIQAPSADAALGQTASTMLRREVAESRPTTGGSVTLPQVTTGESASEVAALLADIPSEARLPLRMLLVLTRRKRLCVTGRIHVPTTDRVAMSLEVMNRRGAVLATQTFYERRPSAPAGKDETAKAEGATLDAAACLALVPRGVPGSSSSYTTRYGHPGT